MKLKNSRLSRSTALLLLLLLLMQLFVLPASAASVPSVSSSTYYACYTLSASGRVYAYTSSSLTTRTGGYIACATDECRIIGISGNAVYVSYPVSGGRRTEAWFPRSAFTSSDLNASGFTAVTASGKITTYRRASGSAAYGYIAKGDTVTILGTSGSRTQVIYNVGSHYKLAFVETSQVSKYLTSGTSTGAAIAEGAYTLTTALKSGMVLDVSGNSSENGANIQIYNSNNTSAQIYQISAVGGGWYKIIHTGSGKAVDVSGGTAASATNVWLYEYNHSAAQHWRFIPYGYGGGYLIQNKLGYFLDVAGGATDPGTNVWVYQCNYTKSQIWYLNRKTAPQSLASANLGKVNFIKQNASTCKATSAAMAANLILGSNTYSTSSMIAYGVMCKDLSGCTYRGSDGGTYRASYKFDSYVGSLSEVTGAVEKAVADGLPIVVAVHRNDGTRHHWVVIVGKDSGGNYLVVDPSRSGSGSMADNVRTMSSLGYAFGLTDYSSTHYGYISFTRV